MPSHETNPGVHRKNPAGVVITRINVYGQFLKLCSNPFHFRQFWDICAEVSFNVCLHG